LPRTRVERIASEQTGIAALRAAPSMRYPGEEAHLSDAADWAAGSI
jgi:hypothetical protein